MDLDYSYPGKVKTNDGITLKVGHQLPIGYQGV